MESWVPLLDIFMNSPCPENEASLWLQQSFNPSLNTSSLSTSFFLSLLTKPTDAIIVDSSLSSSSPSYSSAHQRKRFMWLQTLPDAVQARILSFLASEHVRFNKQDLSKLARDLLNETQEQHFWVMTAARQLLDVVADSNCEPVSGLKLDYEENEADGKFGSVPDWLEDAAGANDSVLPWLPMSVGELNMKMPLVTCEEDEDLTIEAEEGEDGNFMNDGTQGNLVHPEVYPIDHEVQELASCLKLRILNLESSLNATGLAIDIRQICIGKGKDSLTVLGLIEPWNADDEIVPTLLSGLLDGNEDGVAWTSNIMCSIVLPKLLVLEKPASRVLITAIIQYCKVHHKAAVYALLFPLILRKGGINNPICDVITRIIGECLHPAHVSAFCQKLLCQEEDRNRYICLPCHQNLVSKELVWTEQLFSLFQNILNHNVHMTQDSVDQLVSVVQESAVSLSKSLKFANFLLCLVSKCSPLIKGHKLALNEAVGNTSTFLTKSILSKLAGI